MDELCREQVVCLVAASSGRISLVGIPPTPSTSSPALLAIQTCGEAVLWQVRFDADGVPDFVFDQPQFQPLLVDYGPGGSNVESIKKALLQWCPSDTASLTRLTAVLLEAYQQYNITRVHDLGDDHVAFEVDTVVSCKGLQVLVGNGTGKVMVSIPMAPREACGPLVADMAREGILPDEWERIMRGSIRVVVTMIAHSQAAEAVMDMRPPWQALLGGVQLPGWTSESCTVDFKERALAAIQAEAISSAEVRGHRVALLKGLEEPFGIPVEVDSLAASQAEFSGMYKGQRILLRVSLGGDFPTAPPGLSVQVLDDGSVAGRCLPVPQANTEAWDPNSGLAGQAQWVQDAVAASLR